MVQLSYYCFCLLPHAYCLSNGGEGGIRTPGTLIRGTHDFQSCTFNRSVTSPERDFKHLRTLPHSFQQAMSPKCLHGVSMHFLSVAQ